jgi:hypothetical protein
MVLWGNLLILPQAHWSYEDSLLNADETKSVSSLITYLTYSVTPYVLTRLKMGSHLSKTPHCVLIGRMKIPF